MERYYGSRRWRYRYRGPACKWPEGHGQTGELDLGTNAGYGLASDEQYARFLLRERLGLNRLPPKTEVYPGVR